MWHLVMFCVIIAYIWWDISNSYVARWWPAFLWIFQKNCVDNISSKILKERDSLPSSVNTIQHPRIQKNNIDHSSKQGSTLISHSHTKTVLGQVLVHSDDKAHVLVVTVVALLNILSFNFVKTLNKSLRFRRFWRSYVNHPVVVSTTVKVALLFLLDVRCSKWPRSFFFSCFCPVIMHLRNLSLLSTPVALMLLTLR